MRIYVDADACPVKAEVHRVATRHAVPVTLVAGSWMRVPMDERVHLEVVDRGLDAADDWIVEHAVPGDIVVTSDIPLADRCLKQGAFACQFGNLDGRARGRGLSIEVAVADLPEDRQVTEIGQVLRYREHVLRLAIRNVREEDGAVARADL